MCKHDFPFRGRLHPLALASACLCAALAAPVFAQNLPTGFSAVTGVKAPTISANGTTMTVAQTAQRGIAQWQGFSIGSGYTVNIAQPNTSSVLLNRVVGGNPSTIAGALNANGHVYLINPNGVVFSKGSNVNVGGLIASTLELSDSNFLAGGKLEFKRVDANGAAVRNDGVIVAAPGGTVALLGGQVSNSGSISTPQGTAGLVSGSKVNVDFNGDGLTTFTIPADSQATSALVENLAGASITADGGRIALQATATAQAQVVNQSGVLRARSISGRDGQIVLGGDTASGNEIRAGGSIDVSGSAADGIAGGSVRIDASRVQVAGAQIDASGSRGGAVEVNAANGINISPDTRIAAEGTSGAGGRIAIDGQGGEVIIGGTATPPVASGALLSVASSGGAGGSVLVSGRNVGLLSGNASPNSAWIDASGAGQGGDIAIRAKADPGVASSGIIAMDSGFGLHADAVGASGNGGNITLLGDNIVRAHGSLTARAGAAGGDGGIVETSAPTLELAGIRVDASAPMGAAGNWLLDPYDVTITHGSAIILYSGGLWYSGVWVGGAWIDGAGNLLGGWPLNFNPFDPATGGITVYDGDINAALNQGSNVTITTGTSSPAGVTPVPNGDITFVPNSSGVDVAIRKTSGGPATLTLDAAGSIIANQGNPIIESSSGLLNVTFNAGGDVLFHGSVATNGGNVAISAVNGGAALTDATIDTRTGAGSGGSVAIKGAEASANSRNGVTLWGARIYTSTGDVQIDGASAFGSGVALSAFQGISSSISTTSGSITLVGSGNLVPYGGVALFSGSTLTTTNGGNVNITGNQGGVALYNSTIDTRTSAVSGGNVSIRGEETTGYSGVDVRSTQIYASTGDVKIYGHSGSGNGVSLFDYGGTGGSSISTTSGSITLTGEGCTDATCFGSGVQLFNGSAITGGGDINVAGLAHGNGAGVYIEGNLDSAGNRLYAVLHGT